MRKLADALFPQVRQDVLAATTLNPERWWYMAELARHLELSPSSLQRELASLLEVGILERKEEGRQIYYRPNPQCPILPELQGLIVKTSGVVDTVCEGLKRFSKKIRVGFVYGSFAKGTVSSGSDIDIMLIGAVGLSDIAPKLKQLESALGREVNPTIYSEKEFSQKLRHGDHFISSVVNEPKLFLVGTDAELDEFRGQKPSKAA